MRRPVPWGTVAGLAVMAAGAIGIGEARALVAAYHGALREVSDVYALPSPEQTVAVSLGHRAALADLIYVSTLVSYGIHGQERRRFEFASNYLETVIALDPTLRDAYFFADTILTLQSVRSPVEEYHKARAIQARGLEEFPYDAELWLTAGQFLAFLAPGAFEDPQVQKEWRVAGARLMVRGCTLAADDPMLGKKCFGAGQTLTRAGEREATIHLMERLISLSDDPDIRARARRALEYELGQKLAAVLADRRQRFDAEQAADLPFATGDLYLLIGPATDPAHCAGGSAALGCATTWRAWVDRLGEAL
ncbi:MAG: hypothetical protein JW751_14155 [Polyangiaceae bacterium]|nr:hypothetical protein [Polyangiaceae bacterium]